MDSPVYFPLDEAALPITQILPALRAALPFHNQLVLQAEPGAGKSTQVPLALLQHPLLQQQKILLLEPRRLAAIRLAEFLAQQLGEPLGKTVGYRVRNQQKISAATRLEVVTEGILTRMLQSDPELSGVGLVIFDEFHERSLQADLGLSLLLDIQQNLREDLKCLLMSATLDLEGLRACLPDAATFFCPGRAYPVSVSYHPSAAGTPWQRLPQLPEVLALALKETDGDVLIFLPGQAEIFRAIAQCQALCERHQVVAFPLYGALSRVQQAAVFALSVERKVIFSTNLAETSITLPRIRAVIDSGLQKSLHYDAKVGMSRLKLTFISQASATQRMGRAGRVAAGHCYRLWSPQQQSRMREQDAAEIEQADLTGLRMELALWGVKAEQLQWVTPPPPAHLAAAESVLQQLQLLTLQGRLTALGEQALLLHPEPRFGKLLALAQGRHCLPLACDLVALLQEGSPFTEGDSLDLQHHLQRLWHALKKGLETGAKQFVWQGWLQTRKKLYQRFDLPLDVSAASLQEQLGALLALAFTDRIGRRRHEHSAVYKLANGRAVQLPSNASFSSEWLVAIDADANVDNPTQNGRLYLACAFEWSEVASELRLQAELEVRFDPQKGKVIGLEKHWLGKLCVEQCLVNNLPVESVQAAWLTALSTNFEGLPWRTEAKALAERCAWLGQFRGFEDFAKLSPPSLQNDLEWLQPYLGDIRSLSGLQRLDLAAILRAQLDYGQWQRLQQHAPQTYRAPSGRDFVITYQGRQAKVSLPLQQLFGELSSPKLADGQVALTFELLSPAQRPIQVTADLANFWLDSYHEVAKEMRGRYPKHRWPQEPLLEKAGGSIKSKGM
ncbi:MAG: ATP-dependent helicase HrpB [Thiotrichales bacterium]|nr:ATP-dependent helicase HrpB [Thiotrichales bacterium]